MNKAPARKGLPTNSQVLDAIGIHPRIAFPFSPKKVVPALHYLAELRSSPRRVEHPLLRLKWVMAVLVLADIRHFHPGFWSCRTPNTACRMNDRLIA